MILLVVAYLGGALTIASPCILPVVPIILARGALPFLRGLLPTLIGMALTFSGVASLAAVGGYWIVRANEIGRSIALVVFGVLGIALLSRNAAAFLARPAVALGNRLAGSGGRSVASSLLLGTATGFLWAPCAGPILGLILTGAALKGPTTDTLLLLVSYAFGAATALALAILAGGRVLAAMKRFLGFGERIRQGLGIAVLASVIAIALGLDTSLSTQAFVDIDAVERNLLARFGIAPAAPSSSRVAEAGEPAGEGVSGKAYRSRLPDRGASPDFGGATAWLNSAPLTAEQLRGKVVLVNFWTYSCINCIRTLPYIRAWADKYKAEGLVVVGVHTPEFAFEKTIHNVGQAIDRFGIRHPVAIDNDFKVWLAFRNSYWPALYVVDTRGRIRHCQFGEGDEVRTERAIQDLLAEGHGGWTVDTGPVKSDGHGAQAPADPAEIRSGETYLGYRRAAGFASPEDMKNDRPQTYTAPGLRLNQWALLGTWTAGPDKVGIDRPDGGIAFRFRARDLHLVLGPGPTGRPIRFRVIADGVEPGADHGADIDADGRGIISETRLYQLVRQRNGVRERLFEIRFLDPGAEAYAFTFG